jgi:hypothetical protein
MQRAGIISPSFRTKVHLTKVAPAEMHRRVKMSNPCEKPDAAIKRANMANMPVCAEPNAAIKRVNMTNMPICTEPNAAIKRVNMTNIQICAEPNAAIKRVNMTSKSIHPVLQPRTVKRTIVTASTAGQPLLGPCLKQNLTNDTLDSLMKEFKDVFEADNITPLTGDPMQIHLKWDDPSYRPIRVSHHRKVPLHFQEEADKTLKWFLDSGVIVPVPPTENVEWVSPGFFVAKPNGKVRLVTDLRAINQFVIRPCHPFPSPRDVVRNIKTDSKWFCKLDALQGYYQIPLDKKSSYLTTFLLPSGRYQFLRAPMGMKNSSDVFCHRTDNIFAAVPDLLKIVDNVLLQAATEEELLVKLLIALTACRAGNLTVAVVGDRKLVLLVL